MVHGSQWLTAAKVELDNEVEICVVNCHWSPANYGPFIVQEQLRDSGAPTDLREFQAGILARVDKTKDARGYEATLKVLRPFLDQRETVVLAGDFNEPSHLDWSERYAKNGGDRWVNNPTNIPLRFAIEWRGSTLLEKIGMQDTYRSKFQDEVKNPGHTWTPPYAIGTQGRRDYNDQVLDRIDRIYFAGKKLRLLDVAAIGESVNTSKIVYEGEWPSDHRAVVTTFECLTK